MRTLFTALLILSSIILMSCSNDNGEKSTDDAVAEQTTITVYSSRKEHLIKPLFDLYTEKTGVHIQYITDKAGALITRLGAEGENTPADLLITVDAGNLWHASKEGLLQPTESKTLENNVPSYLQDPENRWFGLSIRARTIVYSTERATPEEVKTYESLATDAWKGRLCLRTSKKVYNQSLVASMINQLGEEATESLVKAWVNNLATEPFSNDTKAMEAVAAGQCDATIVNTYYFGRLQEKQPNIPLAIAWPNQDNRGVHINISGAGVTANAKQPEAAKALLEWLSTPEAQDTFAALNKEYPVNPAVSMDPAVAAWGEFKADTMNIAEAGRLQAEAIKLMDRAGYR